MVWIGVPGTLAMPPSADLGVLTEPDIVYADYRDEIGSMEEG